jgi:hypothetical protein
LLGYGYIFGILLSLLGAIAAVIAAMVAGKNAVIVELAIPLIVLVGVVLKALWVKLEPVPHARGRVSAIR